jgi:hypothetical protein
VVAPHILKREVWEVMEKLEETVAELPGVDPEAVAAVAKRAGNSSEGKPPRPRPADGIGTSRYFAELMHMMAETLISQQERIGQLEAELALASGAKK